jgi:PAS domain S-box-containing protein
MDFKNNVAFLQCSKNPVNPDNYPFENAVTIRRKDFDNRREFDRNLKAFLRSLLRLPGRCRPWASALSALVAPGIAVAGSPPPQASHALPWMIALVGTLAAVLAAWRCRATLRNNLLLPARLPEKRLEGFDPDDLVALLDISSDWLWKTDDEHRYVHLTAGLHDHSMMDPADFLGRRPWEIDSEASPETWERYRRSIAQGEPVRLEITRHDRLGGRRHLELTGGPVFVDSLFVGYHGFGRDVTRYVEVERALRENQVRYQEVIESIKEVIFRTDTNARFTFLNRAWERSFGHPLRDTLTTSIVDYIHPDDQSTVVTEFARVISGAAPAYAGQFRLRAHNGETRWIEATAHPVSKRGGAAEPEGLVGTLFDVTVRRIAEMTLRNLNQELEARVKLRTAELEASNRELEAFSYSVSHDLRAPLRAIEGFATILEDELADRLDEEARGHILRIRKASQRMAQTIDDLLKLAQLARQQLHEETFDLSELAVQILDELRAADPDRKVAVDIAPGLIVTADRNLMQVVLENLLGNAWKFSAGRDETRISLSAETNRDGQVFCITDNGAGFDMAFANKLFRPFHRLHGSSEFPGTGIGLANVHRIVMRHGGRIWATAKPNEGASFYFTLGH